MDVTTTPTSAAPRRGDPAAVTETARTSDGDADDGAVMTAMIEAVLGRVPRPITWTRLTSDQAAQVWLALDEWVRWLVRRYALDHRDVPPCWYAHGDLVEELTALWTAHQGAYDPAGHPSGPADWHHTLNATRTRLQAWAGRTGCRHGQHRAPHPPDWAADPAEAGYLDDLLAHIDTQLAERHQS